MTAVTYPWQGDPALQPLVDRALRGVTDPEMGLSIVDLGLVQGVEVLDDGLRVTVTMTSAACPVTEVLLGDVQQALDDALPPEWALGVSLSWEPPWTPERVSPAGRAFLQGRGPDPARPAEAP